MQDIPTVYGLILLMPLVGAAIIAFLIRFCEQEIASNIAKRLTLLVVCSVFVLVLRLYWVFDFSEEGFQYVIHLPWISLGDFILGVDGISILFLLLVSFIMILCVIFSWPLSITKNKTCEYMICFLILEVMMMGVFMALDLVSFYLFFEGSLMPMFILIGIWGGKNRIYASFKFFLYTFLGSVLMFIAFLFIYQKTGTTSIDLLYQKRELFSSWQNWLFLALFASFAVKIPMFPVHTWLPDAHVEAPTAASVILASILLKMGGYGFLRFSLPFFPDASQFFAPLIITLSVIAIVYASLVAFVQTDIKKMIAYSSVAHMGFVTMGIFTLTYESLQGAIFVMISHGFVSGALFLCIGVLYERFHTRELSFFGGLAKNMPVFAFLFFIFILANIGLPGTSGFVGEVMTIISVFSKNTWWAFGAGFGVVLSAMYALHLYRKIIFDHLVIASHNRDAFSDVNVRECLALVPLVVLVVWFGFYPKPIFSIAERSLGYIMKAYGG